MADAGTASPVTPASLCKPCSVRADGITRRRPPYHKLSRDAEWLYKWGQGWTLDAKGQLQTNGTPVIIQGFFNFDQPGPWLSGAAMITLPPSLPVR